jgi:outer membrane protein assembly factor BamD
MSVFGYFGSNLWLNQLTKRITPGKSAVVLITSIWLLAITGCDTPEKALKSTDLDYKKAKAVEWYNKKEYYKCIPLLEELIGLMKGRQSTEDLYYMYADANFHQGDYLISAYHFKAFYDQYPNSSRAEECLYMYAKSYYMQSPKPSLDQTNTTKALDAYQLFLNAYPTSHKYLAEVNDNIAKLRKKLEIKALEAAELYYKTGNYKAAATQYATVLKNFPDLDQRENVTFMIIKSNYQYAKNSVPIRKSERYDNLIKSFADFQDKFSNSQYKEDAVKLEYDARYQAIVSAYDWAEACPLILREHYFDLFFGQVKKHQPLITDKRQLDDINERVEKAYYLVVKSNFQVSEERKGKDKIAPLEETLKTYYNFVDKYPKSRYFKDAEKIYNASTDLLKKLKTNG